MKMAGRSLLRHGAQRLQNLYRGCRPVQPEVVEVELTLALTFAATTGAEGCCSQEIFVQAGRAQESHGQLSEEEVGPRHLSVGLL